MATVAFAGSTLWDDGSTGVGRPIVRELGARANYQFEPVVRGKGLIAKNLGEIPEMIEVLVQYRLDGTAYSGLRTTLDGLLNSIGTLAWPPSQSLANCLFIGHERVRESSVMVTEAGATVYAVAQVLSFQRLRT
jgi:hypothetical protein